MEVKRRITIEDEIYIDGKNKNEVLEKADTYLSKGYAIKSDGIHYGTTGLEEDKHHWISLIKSIKL